MKPISRAPASLTALDWLFFWSGVPLVAGAVVALLIEPRWQLAAAAGGTTAASVCILQSRYRRRTALAMRAGHPGDGAVGRAAAKIHLQEMGLLLLAIALWLAAGGALSTLS